VFACIFAYVCVCSVCIYVFVLFVIFAYSYCCHFGEIKMNIYFEEVRRGVEPWLMARWKACVGADL